MSNRPSPARHALTPTASGWRRHAPALAAWLAVAVAGPLATGALRVTWLLPVAVLALTAGLLRGGRTLLDRLMLALALLLGAVPVAGLLLTVWPFGLAPQLLGGLGIAAVGAVSVLGGRRLRLPRPTPTDGVVLAGAGAVTAFFGRHLLGSGANPLASLLAGEDNTRHFGLVDAISRVGGYLYWQTPEAVPEANGNLLLYPQGWHLTAAVLDRFARGSAGVAPISTAIGHYMWLLIATYGLLALAILWATRWIAGPLLSGWRFLPVATLLLGLLVFSELPYMLVFGFVSQLYGLTHLVLLIAVLVRRPGGRTAQATLIGLTTIGVGFTYQLLLPIAFLAVTAWLVAGRRHLTRQRFAIVVAALAIAPVPAMLGVLLADHGAALTAVGSIHPGNRSELIALAALVAAALVAPAGRRLRVWRLYTACLVAAAVLAGGIGAYGLIAATGANYYYEKTLTTLTVVLLIALGAVARLLPRPRAGGWGQAATAGLLTVAVAAAIGFVTADSTYRVADTTRGVGAWASGETAELLTPRAAVTVALAEEFPTEPGVTTLAMGDDSDGYLATIYLAMYQRSMGEVSPLLEPLAFLDPARLGEAAETTGKRLRLIALSPDGLEAAEAVRAAAPDRVLEIETWFDRWTPLPA